MGRDGTQCLHLCRVEVSTGSSAHSARSSPGVWEEPRRGPWSLGFIQVSANPWLKQQDCLPYLLF